MDNTKQEVERILASLAYYARVVTSPHLTDTERMKMVQWLAKTYHETNKVLIKQKTKEINDGK